MPLLLELLLLRHLSLVQALLMPKIAHVIFMRPLLRLPLGVRKRFQVQRLFFRSQILPMFSQGL